MSIVFRHYGDVLVFVEARRNGARARLKAHDKAVAPGSGTRVGKLDHYQLNRTQYELLVLDALLADLQAVEWQA